MRSFKALDILREGTRLP